VAKGLGYAKAQSLGGGLNAWKQAVAPTETQWAADLKKTGQDPAPVMTAFKQSLAKYKSGM
jgi:3-mercaptopyruvate sulfurtransferase SseA